jgi:hypothetical protein
VACSPTRAAGKCVCQGRRLPETDLIYTPAASSCGGTARGHANAVLAPRFRRPNDDVIEPRPGHWCGTGAVDPGYLFPAGQAAASVSEVHRVWQLTPLGAWPLRPGQTNMLDVFQAADRWQHRARQGDTGLLMPNRATCLHPDRATALRPGQPMRKQARRVGPVTVPERTWRQWPNALRNLAVARGLQPPDRVVPTAVLGSKANRSGWGKVQQSTVLLPGASGGPGVRTTYKAMLDPEDVPLSPADLVPSWIVDPCGCEGTYECALAAKVVLDYAGAKLCVPLDWFYDHVAYDSWYLQEDTMDILWSNVRSRGTGMDPDVLDEMIDCWMIDTDQDRTGRTYSMFFCSVKLRVRAAGSRVRNKTLGGRCEDKGTNVECSATDKWPVADFDDWRASLRSPSTAEPSIKVLMPDGGGLVPLTGPVSGFADVAQQSINFPATVVAFNGYSLDFSLFWARAALQHFVPGQSRPEAWWSPSGVDFAHVRPLTPQRVFQSRRASSCRPRA